MTKPYYLYVINFPNGKRYFGITCDLRRRLAGYKTHSLRGSNKQKVFNAIRKYGVDSLSLTPLVLGEEGYIRELERRAIAQFETRDPAFGYNQAIGGEMSPVAGIGHTTASKAKMSISQKKRIRDPEEIRQFATNRLGKPCSATHRQRLGESAKRRWSSMVETRSPITIERIKLVKVWLAEGLPRKEISLRLALSKVRTRLLVIQAGCYPEPILPDEG